LLDVAKKLPTLALSLSRGEGYILDQLKRALSSAILNLSEGNGRTSQKERNRFFDISLASISESASAIDIIHAYGYVSRDYAEGLKSQLRLAYAMIRKLRKPS
jgi:four helix bundle protein